MTHEFTHVDAQRQPAMVDVSGKAVTHRTAVAHALVRFPAPVAEALREAGFETSKGPVFQTAIIAGVIRAAAAGTSWSTHELLVAVQTTVRRSPDPRATTS
mgnify:CR=1 FL=1